MLRQFRTDERNIRSCVLEYIVINASFLVAQAWTGVWEERIPTEMLMSSSHVHHRMRA